MPPQAKTGDRVKLRYTGKLDDGTVFDSSEDCFDDDCGCDDGPLEFTIGAEDVLPALEQAVVGMAAGEDRVVRITRAEAYGDRNEEMVIQVEREQLPENLDPEVGQVLELTNEEEQTFPVWVVEVTPETVTLDANHPLAGQDLTFELELLEIIPAH